MSVLSIVLLVCSLIGGTEQLICSTNCLHYHVRHGELAPPRTCSEIQSDICKAQITAYYNGKTIPNHFNYTFGFAGVTREEENKEFIQKYGLLQFAEYQFIVNAKKGETILSADIYCTDEDDCAWIKLKQLAEKYTKQKNPFHQLKSFIYSDPSPTKLICYDPNSQTNISCSPCNNPVCISNSTDPNQALSSGLDPHIHYRFTVSLPDNVASQRTTESVICNIDYCNSENTLSQLERIARSYTYGNDTSKNTGNRKPHQTLFRFLFLNVFLFLIEFSY